MEQSVLNSNIKIPSACLEAYILSAYLGFPRHRQDNKSLHSHSFKKANCIFYYVNQNTNNIVFYKIFIVNPALKVCVSQLAYFVSEAINIHHQMSNRNVNLMSKCSKSITS